MFFTNLILFVVVCVLSSSGIEASETCDEVRRTSAVAQKDEDETVVCATGSTPDYIIDVEFKIRCLSACMTVDCYGFNYYSDFTICHIFLSEPLTYVVQRACDFFKARCRLFDLLFAARLHDTSPVADPGFL